jgi:hypothetical protein
VKTNLLDVHQEVAETTSWEVITVLLFNYKKWQKIKDLIKCFGCGKDKFRRLELAMSFLFGKTDRKKKSSLLRLMIWFFTV